MIKLPDFKGCSVTAERLDEDRSLRQHIEEDCDAMDWTTFKNEGNWDFYCLKVTVSCGPFTGDDYLGCMIAEDWEVDTRAGAGGYLDDMIDAAHTELLTDAAAGLEALRALGVLTTEGGSV